MTVRAIEAVIDRDLDATDAALRTALAEQGFGVLTEIDIAAVLKAKLGVERAPLRILGACNPNLAHQALEVDPAAALVLPCNVALSSGEDGTTQVRIVDPRDLMSDPALAPLAEDAATRLTAALDSVARPEG